MGILNFISGLFRGKKNQYLKYHVQEEYFENIISFQTYEEMQDFYNKLDSDCQLSNKQIKFNNIEFGADYNTMLKSLGYRFLQAIAADRFYTNA